MNSSDVLKEFATKFCEIHSNCPEEASLLICSFFTTCYSIMDSHNRNLTILSIMRMAKRIGEEKFEDGQDFLDFLKEKIDSEGI